MPPQFTFLKSLLLGASLWLAGCSDADRLRLVGQWEIDQIEEISDRVSSDDATSVEAATKMSVHFFRSGKLKTETMIGTINSTKNGTWEFQDYQQDQGIMRIECDLAGQNTQHEIEFQDTDTIFWIPPNLAGTRQKIRFLRMRN